MSANTIIDTAPLGALIRYADGSPKPPARFTKKLAASERPNGVGRLVKKEPPRPFPTWTAPASFTLHEGNFSSDGVILVTVIRSHSADSRLSFDVIEEPKLGQVRVLLDFGGSTELLHLASSVTAAKLWIAKEGYRNARLQIVCDKGDGAGEVVIFASPNTLGHSPKARLVVTMTEVRSESWSPDCAKQIAQFVRCPAVVCVQAARGENDEAHAGQLIRHPALFAAAGLSLQPVHQIDDVEDATRLPLRTSARAMAMPRWVLPMPVLPTPGRAPVVMLAELDVAVGG